MKVSRRDLLAGAAGIAAFGSIGGRAIAVAAARHDQGPRQAEPGARAARDRRKSAAAAARGEFLRHAAPGSLRDDHALRPAFRTASRRRARDRSESLLAADPRHGRAADGLHARRPQALPRRQPRSLPRVLGQLRRPRRAASELTPQQLAGLTSTSEWTGVPLATLFREVGAQPEGHVVPRRRAGRRGADAQRSGREGATTMRSSPTGRTAKRSAPSRAIRRGCSCPAGKATPA